MYYSDYSQGITLKGRFRESAARKYFQQLTATVDFCHNRGAYHCDLKPENIILHETENLKVSDFGLSTIYEIKRQDACGTPAYVVPEVINKRRYDGEKADIWSCGVILFVLLADAESSSGHKEQSTSTMKPTCLNAFDIISLSPAFDLSSLFEKDNSCRSDARFTTQNSASTIVSSSSQPSSLVKTEDTTLKRLGRLLLWIGVGRAYHCDLKPENIILDVTENLKVSDFGLSAIYEMKRQDACGTPAYVTPEDDSDAESSSGHKEQSPSTMKPTCLNAFDIISLSPAFDLSSLFEKDKSCRSDARFTTQNSASTIVSRLEEVASMGSFTRFRLRNSVDRGEGVRNPSIPWFDHGRLAERIS
ncbi:CBL-interacting protein kinase 5 [Capsicum annuum]|nr:CBL-interacting protein kinase 5 [Capsicum annuum]